MIGHSLLKGYSPPIRSRINSFRVLQIEKNYGIEGKISLSLELGEAM